MKILKRKTLAALLALSLLASLLPLGAQPVLAAAPNGQVIYVGGVEVTSGGYWTTDSEGNVTQYTEEGTPSDNYIHYDADTNTLTLHNATIKKGLDYSEGIQGGTYILGSAIGVFNQNGDAELTITLAGSNTIEDVSTGIFVLAHSSYTGDATLTITGSGSLTASGKINGINVQSNSGDATLTIQSADVTLTSNSGNGVTVQAGSAGTQGHTATLTVNGGKLTASGAAGIQFNASNLSYDITTELTVSGNALVDTRNGGIEVYGTGAVNTTADDDATNGGTVFDGKDGTVYGDVTLQEDLTISEGESLTIGDEASLIVPNGKTLTNNGTIDNGGTLTNSGTVTNNGTINVESGGNLEGEPTSGSGTVVKAPTITTPPTNQSVTVGQTASFTVEANGDSLSYQWQQSADNGTNWNNISGATSNSYTTDAATLEMNNYQYQCVVSNSAGSVTSQAATLTVQAKPASVPVTDVSLDKDMLNLFVGDSQTLTATVEPSNATNKAVTWSSSDSSIVTVGADQTDNTKATVKALKEGSATITATTADGNKTATCTVTVKEPPYTGKYSYELTTSVGDHGSLTVDRYATEGDEVTITVTPDEAYKLDDLSVTAGGKEVTLTAGGDGTFSFTMPSADVKITATFAEDPDWTEPEEPATDVSDIFLDIAPNAWYKDAVQYAYDSGLMTGVSAHEFAPEATTTRAMIVSMLARLEGVESAESAGFADVAANDWYATAVNWAAASGITSGTGDGNFSPNTAITREQLAAILMNYAQYKGQDVSARATLDTYNDATAISSWANDVMSWAVAEGLLTGVTADTLQPQGAATRAQVAAILQRFLSE